MRLSSISLLIISCAAMVACSDTATTQPESIDKEAIKKEITLARNGYFDAWKNGDAADIISYQSDDFISMPTIDITEDFEAIKESTFDITEQFIVKELDYEPIEVFIHADMAYELGWLDDTLIDKESGETMQGHQRILMVWKKVDDAWKLHRWMMQD